tara:strand:- start:2075 stop:3193 length:1119 start_codon:yes stop_codon:yes gene_type:complete
MRGVWIMALLAWCTAAQAHKPSDSYLRVALQGSEVTGRWDVPLRDLDYVLGLDADGDGRLQWRELRQRENEIQAFMLSHLAIEADGRHCGVVSAPLKIADLADGPAASVGFAGRCATAPQRLTVRYGLFFEVDPQHRGLLQLRFEDTAYTGVFSPQRRALDFDRGVGGAWAAFIQYFRVGIFHIAIGLDHLLFLAGLLLPAVVWRQGGRWQAAPSARVALVEVVKVVSAFTVAHAATLSLASLDLLRLPTRLTESLVAATIVFAAVNNLVPMVRRRLWAVAFAFGLIHGAGYASVLGDLGLDAWTLVVALLGFNLGVEGMQLAVVALWVPLAYRLRHQAGYQWGVVGGGSLLVAALGTLWWVERTFNLRFAW